MLSNMSDPYVCYKITNERETSCIFTSDFQTITQSFCYNRTSCQQMANLCAKCMYIYEEFHPRAPSCVNYIEEV